MSVSPAGVLRVFSPNMKMSCKFSWQILEMNNGINHLGSLWPFRSFSDQAWQPYSPFFSDLYNRLGLSLKERLQLWFRHVGVSGVARQVSTSCSPHPESVQTKQPQLGGAVYCWQSWRREYTSSVHLAETRGMRWSEKWWAQGLWSSMFIPVYRGKFEGHEGHERFFVRSDESILKHM